MRVLWLVRKNLTQHPGGDTTQILRTAQALRTRGVEVTLCDQTRPEMAGYDLVHLFHLDRLWENEPHCRRIRSEGRPAVLSTIYWPPDEFDRGGRAGVQGFLARRLGSRAYENLRLIQRWGMHAARERSAAALGVRCPSFRRAARFVLETARVLLPYSIAEQQQIARRFGVVRPAVIVPNAADVATFGPPDFSSLGPSDPDAVAAHDPAMFGPCGPDTSGRSDRATLRSPAVADKLPRAGVLCVGRIEPRKNQLTLIEALRDTGIPLTLVGQAGRYSGAYYQRCRRLADQNVPRMGQNVRFLGQQPPAALGELYRRARVHACVSWYETPGLASLEAALCGGALVVTPGGCTQEYFGPEAHYCRPDNVGSIRAAVEAALAGGPSPVLAQRVAHEYTWDQAAAKTLTAYRLALEHPG